jgi:hypothetical protein
VVASRRCSSRLRSLGQPSRQAHLVSMFSSMNSNSSAEAKSKGRKGFAVLSAEAKGRGREICAVSGEGAGGVQVVLSDLEGLWE